MTAKAKAKPLTRTFKKEKAASKTSLSIEEQTKAFFAAGGKVEKIETGVSGQPSKAPAKPFTIGNKPKTE